MQRREMSVVPVKSGRLARAMSDLGRGEIVRQLAYKAAWYGKTLGKVNRRTYPPNGATRAGISRDPDTSRKAIELVGGR